MNRFLPILALAAVCASAQASSLLNFSFTSDATPVVTGSPLFGTLSVDYTYIETVDGNGDPLATPSFRPDLTAGAIVVGDPSARSYGAPIAGNALDAVDQAVLFSFTTPQDISSFGVTLDNSTLGTLFGTNVEFYSAADLLLGSLAVNQNTPGFTLNNTSLLFSGVSKIVVPAGAFYDNLSFTASAAPEPGRVSLLGLGLAAAVLRRRRR